MTTISTIVRTGALAVIASGFVAVSTPALAADPDALPQGEIKVSTTDFTSQGLGRPSGKAPAPAGLHHLRPRSFRQRGDQRQRTRLLQGGGADRHGPDRSQA